MSSFGEPLLGISNDSYYLVFQSSKVMIVLSMVALVGGLIQAYRYNTRHPYMLVCIAALCYLIQGAINSSLESKMGSYTDMLPLASAGYLFGPLSPILAWVLVLDSFRKVQPLERTFALQPLEGDLPFALVLGYMWACLLAFGALGNVGSLGSTSSFTQGTLLKMTSTFDFITYGLWGFLPLYLREQMKCWNTSRSSFRSFAVFITLVFLVTIGRTVNQAMTKNDVDGSHAMAAQVVDFVMARIFGIVALLDATETFYDKYLLSPLAQVCLLGLVFLLGPGMYNALNTIAAHNNGNVNVMDAAYGLLYACFALVGFLAGSVTNKLGVCWTLTVGVLGYLVHASSQWVYDTTNAAGYLIAAGAIFGCCAGLLWSAQGAVIMSYPEEKNKGKYISIFWALFNIGGIIGSITSLGLGLNNRDVMFAENGIYIAFIVIMFVGVVLTPFMVTNPSHIIRSDNTKVEVLKAGNWKNELMGVLHVWKDWRMIALIPAFFASDFGTQYQTHMMVIGFDRLTVALNTTIMCIFQILGSVAIGSLLDYQKHTRRIRALLAGAILFILMMAIWGGGIAFQLTFEIDTSARFSPAKAVPQIGWDDPRYGGPFFLCIFYGLTGAMYQSFMYWLMGAMSNDPKILSRYAGFYKGTQLAGTAVAYGVSRSGVLLRWECLISWIILIVSFPGIFLVANRVTESNLTEGDVADKEGVDIDTRTSR